MEHIMGFVTPVITGIFAVIVTAMEVRASKDRKRVEARAKRRAEEALLSMQLMVATCQLGVVTAKAVMHQHTNGDVEESMQAAETAKTAYDSFVSRLAAEQSTKV